MIKFVCVLLVFISGAKAGLRDDLEKVEELLVGNLQDSASLSANWKLIVGYKPSDGAVSEGLALLKLLATTNPKMICGEKFGIALTRASLAIGEGAFVNPKLRIEKMLNKLLARQNNLCIRRFDAVLLDGFGRQTTFKLKKFFYPPALPNVAPSVKLPNFYPLTDEITSNGVPPEDMDILKYLRQSPSNSDEIASLNEVYDKQTGHYGLRRDNLVNVYLNRLVKPCQSHVNQARSFFSKARGLYEYRQHNMAKGDEYRLRLVHAIYYTYRACEYLINQDVQQVVGQIIKQDAQ